MGNPIANEIVLVLLGAIAAFFVSFSVKAGSTRLIVVLSIVFSLTLFMIDRIIWLRTERNLVDHATCLLAPAAQACSKPPAGTRATEGQSAGRAPLSSASPADRAAPPAAPRPAPSVQGAAAKTALSAAPPDAGPLASTAGSERVFQLGAFVSADLAHSAWRHLQARFPFMPGGQGVVTPVQVAGRSIYRLRSPPMPAGEAKAVCEQLRIAGESCLMVD